MLSRRKFLQLSSVLGLGYAWLGCNPNENSGGEKNQKAQKIPFKMFSDQTQGHFIFGDWQKFPIAKKINTEYLVVGGGIAGMSSAVALHQQKKEFYLAELSNELGGTATAFSYQNTIFGQGAHYDLVYPDYFGENVLKFWENLKVIEFDKIRNAWTFAEQQYFIQPDKEGYCYIDGKFREDVLPDEPLSREILAHFQTFLGKLKLPSRLMKEDAEMQALNKISFEKYLNNFTKTNLRTTHPQILQGLDYHILDDFGGTCAEVSALAGLFYYGSRVYEHEEVEIFSPPQGNFYFIQKMKNAIPNENIHLQKTILKIEEQPKNNDFLVDIWDNQKQERLQLNVKKVIYAGQKHALKYIFPADYALFSNQQNAPWLVMNFVMNHDFQTAKSYWQNEMLLSDFTGEERFLGFVDSETQYGETEHKRVLSAYYCFQPSFRPKLRDMGNFGQLMNTTLGRIGQYYHLPNKDFEPYIEAIFGRVYGHAMAIPAPNYLLQDANSSRKHKNLVYAGVDNFRLPLMLDAVDSGIEATRELGIKN